MPVDTSTLSSNLGTILTAVVSSITILFSLFKIWAIVDQRLKILEEAAKAKAIADDRFTARVERFIEAEDEGNEHILESVYQLTTAVRGIDGYNGLTGRVRDLDGRLQLVERLVAGADARFEVYKELNRDKGEK